MSRALSDVGVPPPAFYSNGLESSIGHSNSHSQAGTAAPRPSFNRPPSTAGAPQIEELASQSRGGDRYLEAARGIELTREEKQEGYYDPDLLQSRPRNTAASAVPSTAVADAAQQRGGEASTDTSAVPYASRPGDDPAERIGSKSQRSSSGNPKTGVNGRSEKPKTSGYPSRPRGADDKGTHHRHGGRGRGDRGGGRTAPRRKRKQLAWWQKPRTFVALIALIIVVGAAVGLGVGLTAGKKGNERSPGNPASSPSGSGPTNSRSVIQPSVSEASTAVASATSTPLSPEPSVSIAPRSRIARDGPPKARSRWT
ncbi:hypothetical protein JCM3766R1_002548 [Sporobolomyces carnicolor]